MLGYFALTVVVLLVGTVLAMWVLPKFLHKGEPQEEAAPLPAAGIDPNLFTEAAAESKSCCGSCCEPPDLSDPMDRAIYEELTRQQIIDEADDVPYPPYVMKTTKDK